MRGPSSQLVQTQASMDDLWIKLRGIERLHDVRMEPRLVESHVLFIVKAGGGRLMIDLLSYRLSQDTVHIAHPGQTAGITAEIGEKLDLYMIMFDVRSEAGTEAVFPYDGEIHVRADTQTQLLCDSINDCFRNERALERFRGQSFFQELLYGAMSQIRLSHEADSRTALNRTKAYIDSHYSESLTIERLARMAEISPKYYVNLFKKTYGISAIDYLTEARVNAAKQLMLRSEARLRDIAHQVGYNDEFYFSRMFKKETGMSPTAYLKKRSRKIAAYTPSVLGQLLALKTIPYAAPLHPKWTAYYYKTYRDEIPLHLSAYRFNEDWESNIETLIRHKPDTIISMDDLEPEERERLEKYTSVEFIPIKDTDWRDRLRLIATYLGLPHEAESRLLSYERKVRIARERIHKTIKDDTVLAISIHKLNCYRSPTRGMREVLYEDLQLKPLSDCLSESCKKPISVEQIAELDADRILLNVCQETESLKGWQELQTGQLWKSLKAVRKNQVYLISSDPWREYSAYACERMVDDLLRQFCGDRPF